MSDKTEVKVVVVPRQIGTLRPFLADGSPRCGIGHLYAQLASGPRTSDAAYSWFAATFGEDPGGYYLRNDDGDLDERRQLFREYAAKIAGVLILDEE